MNDVIHQSHIHKPVENHTFGPNRPVFGFIPDKTGQQNTKVNA